MSDIQREDSESDRGAVVQQRLVKVVVGCLSIAAIDPPVLSLKPWLENTVASFVPGGPTGVQRVESEIVMYTFDHRGRLCFPVGLLSRLRAELERNAYRVEVVDLRKRRKRLRVASDLLGTLCPQQRALVETIGRDFLGQLELRGHNEAVENCALICPAFPVARVVLAVATQRQAHRL
jgi:hypothetical protein